MNKNFGRHIDTILSLPSVYFFLFRKVFRQKKFINNFIEKELYPYSVKNDGSLTPADFKKIKSYYGLGVPGVLGESFCVLRGKALQPRERLCITFLGGISGLLDDLFDDPGKDAKHLEDFILKPEGLRPNSSYEKLLLHFYELGLHYSFNPEEIKQQALKVFKAQEESLEQQRSLADISEIEELTYAKGGNSFLYYRLCLDHPLPKAEKELLYELGGLMQLGNDIFDVWEDHQNGIKTVATLSKDVKELKKNFTGKYFKCFNLAEKTDYDAKNIQRFQKISSLALARVFVCLDQLLKLQQSTGNEFRIKNYTRKEMICNMQKPSNQIRALRYSLKLGTKKNSIN